MGKMRNTQKYSLSIIIFISLLTSFKLDYNSVFVKANPVQLPYYDREFGPHFNNSGNMQLYSGNVSIDCYEKTAKGTGNYIIKNLGNESASGEIEFYATNRPTSIYNISINNTQINQVFPIYMETDNAFPFPNRSYYNIDPSTDIRTNLTSGILVNIDPKHIIELKIEWGFEVFNHYKRDSIEGVINIIETQVDSYEVSYKINGGSFWNGNNIQNENVRFIFHSDKYYTQNSIQLRIETYNDIDDYYGKRSWENHDLEYDLNGNAYIEYCAKNFSNSYGLKISKSYVVDYFDYFEFSLFILIIIVMYVLYMNIWKEFKDKSLKIMIFLKLVFLCFYGRLELEDFFYAFNSYVSPGIILIYFYFIPPILDLIINYRLINKNKANIKGKNIESALIMTNYKKKLGILSFIFIGFTFLMIELTNNYFPYLMDDIYYLYTGILYNLSIFATYWMIKSSLKENRQEKSNIVKEENAH
jgi:hypothetical protein